MLPGKQDGGRGEKQKRPWETSQEIGNQKAKIKVNTVGWRHTNRILSKQGERRKNKRGRSTQRKKRQLRKDTVCPGKQLRTGSQHSGQAAQIQDVIPGVDDGGMGSGGLWSPPW